MHAEFELAKAAGSLVSQRIERLEDDAAQLRIYARDPEAAGGQGAAPQAGGRRLRAAPALHAIPIIPPA